MHPISRREMARAMAAAGAYAATVTSCPSIQAAEAKPALNRFPRMMQDWLVRQVRLSHSRNIEAKRALKTQQDATAYVKSVREKIRESFGPLPQRTPLKPRVTGRLEREGYSVENILFESRPGFIVTANLYLPDSDSPVPGVVGTCGHSSTGKAADYYQGFSQGLAKLGYACLIYDPIGQGERLQYPDDNLKSRVGVGVREHLHAGNQQFLSARIWRCGGLGMAFERWIT